MTRARRIAIVALVLGASYVEPPPESHAASVESRPIVAERRPMLRCATACAEMHGRLVCTYWPREICEFWEIPCSDLPPGAVCRPAVTRLGLWVPPNGPPDPVMVRSLYFPVMRPEPEWKLDTDYREKLEGVP